MVPERAPVHDGGEVGRDAARAGTAFTLRRAGRIRDARGRRLSFLDPYDPRLAGREDVIPPSALRAVRRDLGFGYPAWQRRGYVACVAAFLACVAFLVVWKIVRQTGMDAVERVLWPFNLAVFAFAALMFWRGARTARSKRVRAVMLSHLRCPHCGYDLRDLPADPDDQATVCPECGGAWRLD
ncbi:MAG: FmdB family zinc ribbon protein [Planctomycetota bacterium]|jgi:hypothetical protein